MGTTHSIHEEIESWLAAAVHDQLSREERSALEEHLAMCAGCRALHQEETTMSTLIATTFADLRPDLAFEQRIVSTFRRRTRERGRFGLAIGGFFRWRTTRIAAAAAVLLLTGVWLTGQRWYFLGNEEGGHVGEIVEKATRNDDSLGGLRGRLGWAEQKAEEAREYQAQRFAKVEKPGTNTPVEGLRQLPSFVGKSASDRERKASPTNEATSERIVVTGSEIPTAETESALPVTVYSAEANAKAGSTAPSPSEDKSRTEAYAVSENPEPARQPVAPISEPDRKLIRKAGVELEVAKFDEAVQKITALVTEDKGYVATSSSEKQENGKLRGEIVVKVPPQSLDGFLHALRALGEVKNQTLGTDDVTKNYFDTDARLKNSHILEQRLVEMLQKSTGKVSDLLQVEKELARVRQEIEQMQGELKYMDAKVQFATVTITLSEKDMDAAAAFRLKRSATLALFSPEVETTFAEVKNAIVGTKAQISSSGLDRDAAGEVTAHLVLLLPPDEADAMIARIKGMGRVQSYKENTTREAQGGSEASDTAKDKVDKVELDLTISRTAQEPALQTTTLRILTSDVIEKVARLKESAAKWAKFAIPHSTVTRMERRKHRWRYACQ
jgi:hypothetical protein